MFLVVQLPSFDGLHPAISHFPIALFFLPPLFILIALRQKAQAKTLFAVALGILVAGTLGAYVSAATGDAARDLAPKMEALTKAIAIHEDLGSLVRLVFTILTVTLAAIIYGPRFLKKELGSTTFAIAISGFLLTYSVGLVLLGKAAHSGGLLVHRLGLHARI